MRRWLPVLLAVLLTGLLAPGRSWAQTPLPLNPPVRQWQTSIDNLSEACSGTNANTGVTGTSHSRDWAVGVTSTRDGGYVTAGYAGGTVSTRSDVYSFCGLYLPALYKLSPNGKIEYSYVRHTGGGHGRFADVVELADHSGYAAVGWVGSKLIFARFNRELQLQAEYLTTTTGPWYNLSGKGYSLREVLTYNASGELGGDGFIIGAVAGTGANAGLRFVRLTPDNLVAWDYLLSPINTGAALITAIARPIYSTGTLHEPTATRVAHAPKVGGTLAGFALTGTILETTGGYNMALFRLDVDATGVPATSASQTTAQSQSNSFFNAAPFPYCSSTTASGFDIGTDLEQTADGQQLVVAGIWNMMSKNSTSPCVISANPNSQHKWVFTQGETYLLGWDTNFGKTDPGTGNPIPTTPLFTTYVAPGGAGEFQPQVEPLATGELLIASSRLLTYASLADSLANPTADKWGLNRYYLTKFTAGTAAQVPSRLWATTFEPPVVAGDYHNWLACTFGMAVSQDGSAVICGNDNRVDEDEAWNSELYSNHDGILTKFASECQTNASYTHSAGFKVPAGQSVTWSSTQPIRVKGSVVVEGELIIEGNSTVVEFADTRQTSPEGQFVFWDGSIRDLPVTPTNIWVIPGGHLVVRNGARLTSLQTCAGGQAMWDGITALGINWEAIPQTPGKQPILELTDATIENARFGIVTGKPSHGFPLNFGFPEVPRFNNLINPTPSGASYGGALITAVNTTFHNCYRGVWLTPYKSDPYGDPVDWNATSFTNCSFLADAPLADPLYSIFSPSGASVRYGMQSGVSIFGTTATFNGTRFELNDATADFAAPLPWFLRGTGVSAVDGVALIDRSPAQRGTFKHLYQGLSAVNSKLAYPVRVKRSDFVNNYGGAYLAAVADPDIRENEFSVGRQDDNSAYGLSFYNSTGLVGATLNHFTSQAACDGQTCPNSYGMLVALSDGGNPDMPRPNLLYKNSFDNLSVGIMAWDGNTNLQIRCNSFRGPDPDTQPLIATISEADVEVSVNSNQQARWLAKEQGRCGTQTAPAGNTFSHTCATESDYKLVGLGPQDPTINYNQHDDRTTDLLVTPGGQNGCYSASGLSLVSCSDRYTDNDVLGDICPDLMRSKTEEELKTELASTTEAHGRAWRIDELLKRYLSEEANAHGLDSAVALLERTWEPGFGEQRRALEKQLYGASGQRQTGRNGKMLTGPLRNESAGAGTSQARPAEPLTYFEQVENLLAPLGSDSAITATLRADSTLRHQLEAIATDTLTWGYVAGQAVLTRYLGYHYGPWFGATAANGARQARKVTVTKNAALAEPAAWVSLYPNPTTDNVTVEYQLPAEAATGELIVYDKLGHPWRTLSLRATRGSVTLSLADLPFGVYAYRLLAQSHPVRAGTLVKLP